MSITPYDFMQLESVKCMRGVGNTHAQNTYRLESTKTGSEKEEKTDQNLTALIDWFDVTFDQDYYNLEFVYVILLKYFDLPYYSLIENKKEKDTLWEFNVKKEKGYGQSVSYGDIAIFYDDYGNNEKGIKLSMSGNGCREAELLFRDNYTWYDFLKELSRFQVNFTRIDIAVDDKKGYFNIEDLINISNAGGMVSKFKIYEPRGKRLSATGESLGYSLYIGSPKSRLFIRMYEKNKESNYNGFWNRTELQLRNERAETVILKIIENPEMHVGEFCLGILGHYIKFCNPEQAKNDSNRSRWKPYNWWLEFLQAIKPIKLTTDLPKSNVETKKEWTKNKLSKTLALVSLALAEEDKTLDENLDWLKGILNYGYTKLEQKDMIMIKKYQETKKRTDKKHQFNKRI